MNLFRELCFRMKLLKPQISMKSTSLCLPPVFSRLAILPCGAINKERSVSRRPNHSVSLASTSSAEAIGAGRPSNSSDTFDCFSRTTRPMVKGDPSEVSACNLRVACLAPYWMSAASPKSLRPWASTLPMALIRLLLPTLFGPLMRTMAVSGNSMCRLVCWHQCSKSRTFSFILSTCFAAFHLVGLRLEPSVREELFQLRGPLLPLQQVVGLPCFAVVRCRVLGDIAAVRPCALHLLHCLVGGGTVVMPQALGHATLHQQGVRVAAPCLLVEKQSLPEVPAAWLGVLHLAGSSQRHVCGGAVKVRGVFVPLDGVQPQEELRGCVRRLGLFVFVVKGSLLHYAVRDYDRTEDRAAGACGLPKGISFHLESAQSDAEEDGGCDPVGRVVEAVIEGLARQHAQQRHNGRGSGPVPVLSIPA